MAPKRDLINRLPDKVLSMVFDQLDFESLKNATLTCQRWKNVIFEGGCIDRFVLTILYQRPAISQKNHLESLASRIRLLTEHTTRRYRNFSITVVLGKKNVFSTIWQIIHPKITTDIRFLYIAHINARVIDLLPLLSDSIPSLPHLRTLAVVEIECVTSHQSSPTIRSNSLHHLDMDCTSEYTVDLPKLETFSGNLSALNLPQTVHADLKDLTVTATNGNLTPAIFRRLPALESITWDVPLDEALLLALYEMCPSLTTIAFSEKIIFTDRALVDQLQKFVNLRRLVFPRVKQNSLFYDFSKFTRLEELYIGNHKIMALTLLSLPKSIRKIALRVTPNNERQLMQIIPLKLTEVTKLDLIFDDDPAPEEILKVLPSLKKLNNLSLYYCSFQRSFFLGLDAPLPQLRVLQFFQCTLPRKNLLGLQEKFPNVQNPEFIECTE